MGRYSSDTGGDFTPAPIGTHVARAIKLIDIGTHHGEYEGKPNVRNQVILQWELPLELMEDGQPFIVSKFYTNTLGEKGNLRADLKAWRTRDFTTEELMRFDLESVLGKPCMVTIMHTDKGKAKVVSVTGMPKGMQCPPQVNPSSAFWIDPWNDGAFHALSDGFRKMIMDSDEYKAMGEPVKVALAPGAPVRDPLDEDIPF
jgi:hypothetical protein